LSSYTDYQREWYQTNIIREREKRRSYAKQYRVSNPKARILAAAKQRSKERGLDFSITENDFEIPSLCPILGCPLEIGTRMYAPSLDRIDPTKGYIAGNVWIISLKANVMKNNATPEELQKFARWVENELKIS
jgi:hypothetical protein